MRDGSMKRLQGKVNETMQDEYDFAHGRRGKFYRKDAELIPPVHLEPDILSYLNARGSARHFS